MKHLINFLIVVAMALLLSASYLLDGSGQASAFPVIPDINPL